MYFMQITFKIETQTLIFILNPCHVVTIAFGILSIIPYSLFSDYLACFCYGSTYGALIGIVFAENGELPFIEIVVYYI